MFDQGLRWLYSSKTGKHLNRKCMTLVAHGNLLTFDGTIDVANEQ